jgi:hypothetical protein
MTLLQKLKEKRQPNEVKEIVDRPRDDANKLSDGFEEAGWTTVTSKRQRRGK